MNYPHNPWDEAFSANDWGRWPAESIVRHFCRLVGHGGRRLKVLEVGCGPGAQLWFVEREGHDAYGVDISSVGLQIARSRLLREGQVPRLALGTALALPFSTESLDVVLDVEAFAYVTLTATTGLWSELARVLSCNGTLISLAFGPRTDPALAEYLRHPILRSATELHSAADAAGLTVMQQQSILRTDGLEHRMIDEIVTVAAKP